MASTFEKVLRIKLLSQELTATPAGQLTLPAAAVSLHGCPLVFVLGVETRAEVLGAVPKGLAERLEDALHDAYRWPDGPLPAGGALFDQARSAALTAPPVFVGALPEGVTV